RQLLPQRRSEELRLVGVGPELRQRRGAQPKVGLAPDELDRSKALDALDEEKNASLSTLALLSHAREHEDGVEVVEAGIVDGCVLLDAHREIAVDRHRFRERAGA